MPKPSAGEIQSDFISRCIPIVLKDGTAQDDKQAVAVCNSMWKDAKKSIDPADLTLDQLQEAMKIGARNNTSDKKTIQSMHDMACQLGAECDMGAGKSLNLSYAKSLGINIPDLAVKRTAPDMIHGYTMIWGDPEKVDVEREFFTRDTDFWDKDYGKSARPLTWDHAQDTNFKADTRIGTITDFGDDEIGRWYDASLDLSHRYRKAIDGLIERGVLGTSSDSVLQYIQRQKTKSGATWLAVWPWVGSALTTTPAEPRLLASVDYAKSIGFDYPFPEAVEVQLRRQVEKAKWEAIALKTLYTEK